jgi:5-dehydro-2-deoxygluconokinase
VELPGSRPLRFDHGASVASQLLHWPAEHTVKCLVHYHPDDPVRLRLDQEMQLLHLWQATRESGHELLLEVIPPRGTPDPDAAVLRAVTRFYNLGLKPEWWKLPPMEAAASWDALQALVAARDPHCRGAVVLGLSQPVDALVRGFAQARNPVVKGFMVGRTLWADASLRWLKRELDDEALVAEVAANFSGLVQAWLDSRAPQEAAA